MGATNWSIPAGIFSSADLLLEDLLTIEPPDLNPSGRNPLTINLNHAVRTVTTNPANPAQVTGVQCFDLLAEKQRTYQAKTGCCPREP